VVDRSCAFHRTAAPAKKPDPDTFSVKDAPLAITEAGSRAVIAGKALTVRVRLLDGESPGRSSATVSEPVRAIVPAGTVTTILPGASESG
jgi:hypothetical protein